MFWSNPRLFLNWSARLKITSGAKVSSFCRNRSRSSKDGEMFRGVAERAERTQDVCLSFPILGLHLLAQVLIDRGRPDGVEKGEDFEFLFHAIWCA